MVAVSMPNKTLARAIIGALAPDPIVGGRVYRNRVPAQKSGSSIERPYFVFIDAGANQLDELPTRDAYVFLMTVKCVADDWETAVEGAQRIHDALADQGFGDVGGGQAVVGDAVWIISQITPERLIDFTEAFESAEPIYHVGHQYLFRLDENK